MRVILATLDFPPKLGGVASYYHNIAKHFDSQMLIVAPEQERATSFDSQQDYPIVRTKFLTKYFWPHWISAVFSLYKIWRKQKPDYFLAGQILPIGTVCFILHKLFKMQYGVVCHGMDINILKGRKQKLAKHILEHASFIVVNSTNTRRLVQKFVPNHAHILIIHPCANITEKNIEEMYNPFKDKKIVMTLCRMVERKGCQDIIAALPRIIENVPDARYVLIGNGPYVPTLIREIQKHGMEKYVHTIYHATDAQVAYWYTQADVFAMTPKTLSNGDVEGFGIIYTEANAFGKPVVATNSGGVPDAVVHKETGILLPEGDTEKIADSIILLLQHEEYAKRLGMQGKDRLERIFTWSNQVEKLKHYVTQQHL